MRRKREKDENKGIRESVGSEASAEGDLFIVMGM